MIEDRCSAGLGSLTGGDEDFDLPVMTEVHIGLAVGHDDGFSAELG
jgi:hypothetical protein